jgi:hypothetical protein
MSLLISGDLRLASFVKGCKNDGIWTAIKASCILAGARTLAGALVPLVGTAPTNFDGLFDSGDYNRKTGLIGDGSTKSLDSNRNNNADPQNSKHVSAYGYYSFQRWKCVLCGNARSYWFYSSCSYCWKRSCFRRKD